MSQDPPALSIVVPAYNEEEVLPQFHARLAAALAAMGVVNERGVAFNAKSISAMLAG